MFHIIHNSKNSNAGNSVVAIAFILTAGLMTLGALNKMLLTSQKFERGIASNSSGISALNSLSLILQSPASCAKSGLKDLVINPLPGGGNPAFTVSSLYYPGSTGTGATFAAVGTSLGTGIVVQNIRITEMIEVGSHSTGSTDYFSTLEIGTNQTGATLGARTAPLQTRLILTLDSTKKVLECSGTARTSPVSVGMTLTGVYSGNCYPAGYAICGDAGDAFATSYYRTGPAIKRINIPAIPKKLEITTQAKNGKLPLAFFSAIKPDTMLDWSNTLSVIGLTISPVLDIFSWVRFGVDSVTGPYFEIKKGLNINHGWYATGTLPSTSTYDGEYHWIASY